ncbi:GspH/FimT family pseudopilin [Pseudoduganella violaceinigra]|uniref:GspH/FimT family pseudopilin n=1 Tax=Pseudoduganella violaceinigra TaxID=246602 RepID=UPI0004189300|nr:GspH/FimT family pseudopilin [Pseudoduganella violaceinigra]
MERQSGFTLIEMMVTVGIILILASVGVPAMQDFITNQRIKSTTNDLFSSLLRARSEAIKRNADVKMTPSTSWETGWAILSPNTGEPVLASFSTRSSVKVTGPNGGVTFTPAGRVKGAGNLQFNVSATNGKPRCITVDLGGRPNVQAKSC